MSATHSSSLFQIQSTTTNDGLHKRLLKRIQYLKQIQQIHDRGDKKEQLDLLNKDGLDRSILNPLLHSLMLLNTPPPKENRDNGRVVCISDGLGFFLLELKHKNAVPIEDSEFEPFPKGYVPKIADERFLISSGLFSLGSEAYIVAGYTFPSSELDQGLTRSELLSHLYARYPYIGSPSLKTYRLSLVNGEPSLSTCDNIQELNKPNFESLVEKIGNNIHVIESCIDANHEFLNTSDPSCGLIELSSPHHQSDTCCSKWYCLVIGDRIYSRWYHLAIDKLIFTVEENSQYYFAEENSHHHFEVFDSRVNGWKSHDFWQTHCLTLYSVKHVSELLRHGFGSCIGKFGHGKSKNPLYVVIAVRNNYYFKVAAAAYLVTRTGQVLYYQPLPHFFGGLMKRYCASKSGSVVRVDEKGNTFCAIVPTERIGSDRHQLLFVSTFTIKEIPWHVSHVGMLSLKEQKADLDKFPWAVEQSFVKLVVNEWNAYTLEEGELSHFTPRMGACFL